MAHNLPVRNLTGEKAISESTTTAASSENAGIAADAQNENPRGFHLSWIEGLFLIFLAGLAVLPPVREIHKQLILAAIAILQLLEGQVVVRSPRYGRGFVVFLKILLATALLDHTGELAINSAYYPIYYLPVVTAATYFGTWGTLFWTGLASAAYCSLLIPALQEFALTADVVTELATRILFFFLAAMLVNRFSVEIRRRATAYQSLAEQMSLTNRRLAEVQEEARRSERLAALGQMSAGLAHEIRNPLGVIKGSAEMLHQKLGESNPLASELAGYISSETNRLSALVARFLDFARPQALELTPGDVREVVETALAAVATQRPNAKVIVEREYAAELPPVRMDDRLCEQVFQNLALNAYEAMEPDGGKLRIGIFSAMRGGVSGVEVTLTDNGPGIPPEICEQVFNPFFTTKKAGTGLGLAIVSKIVDELHGSLQLESKPGQGATFRVFFPAAGTSARVA
jgi:signal transduction histidine kinase|nr:ATP-binding protein [Candidatus Acidoferrales bacterium]